ncbi:alpha/beta hydrolase [Paracidobacterium acidisoli]|uniref:Alpha/beta hydrolase n=1 Tax=Paracidobacterium acidisoli TaxID=2303751 RepID=A0A372IKV5_9BACT|nr:alpha/beta family hydrolase [Paracidobacterium acidisoli]MBT9332572.1 alpha/beta hydrolase [Paracidobacterium acidisoli]
MTISTASAVLRTVDDLRGPAGRLEALLNSGSPDANFAALVCHPHPMGGGTMHNKVVYHAMKAFQGLGLPVLRFNFRGTGLSEGEHDHGRGERDDVRAALDWLEREFRRPLLFAGFSFGANVGLHVCCGDARVRGLVGLGVPVHAEGRDYHYEFLRSCAQPKLFVSGTRDQYGPMEKVEAAVDLAPEPKELVWVADADHFFAGKLDEVRAAMTAWTEKEFSPLIRS